MLFEFFLVSYLWSISLKQLLNYSFDSLHKQLFTRKTRSWFAKFSIERTFNFIIFRALLSNELYFNFSVLLYGGFNVQLDVKSGIIIVM